MIKSKHGAALEHGSVYLSLPKEEWDVQEVMEVIFPFELPWVNIDNDGKNVYISTNYRHIVEKNSDLLDALMGCICDPTEYHEMRYTFKFTCSRAIANELIRHRTMSFLQESTRYINYFKEKHGGEITYIKPTWYDKYSKSLLDSTGHRPDGTSDMFTSEGDFKDQLRIAESCYMAALIAGVKPQEARDVLPNATKTELIMTGFASDWRHVMDLRLFGKTGAPHPDMVDLMQKAQKAMQDAGIWEDIMSNPSKFE
jgi:thymidylate synthase (FAD)